MVAANYSHWDTLSDKDSVSLQVNNGPKYLGENKNKVLISSA